MASSLNGTGVTFNDGTTLQSGNIPAANLGSGTANSNTFLRGDRTFAAPSGPPTFEIVNEQIFTASGTWTKPGGFDATDTVLVLCVGGGGSGGVGRRNGAGGGEIMLGSGGGGGGVMVGTIPYGAAAASSGVTIGSGGAARTATSATAIQGLTGGTSSFGTLFSATGGLGGGATLSTTFIDGRIGGSSRHSDGVGNATTSTKRLQASGSGRAVNSAGSTFPVDYGMTGGGGSAGAIGATLRSQNIIGGTGRIFGDGGEGRANANAFAGSAPGGGGGGAARNTGINTSSGAGARGEVIVYIVRGRVSSEVFFGWGLGA